MDELSTVGDVLSIRKNVRRHVIAITVQVTRISETSKYKFLTCAVKSESGSNQLRTFSIKCWANELPILADINNGDIIKIAKLWKKHDGRRLSGSYSLSQSELDIELFVWSNTTVEVIQSLTQGVVEDFALITAALPHVQIRGIVDSIPEDNVILLRDTSGGIMEVIFQKNHGHEFMENETWTVGRNITLDDGMAVHHATTAARDAPVPPVDDLLDGDGSEDDFEALFGDENGMPPVQEDVDE